MGKRDTCNVEFIQLFAALRPVFAACAACGAVVICGLTLWLNGGFAAFGWPGPPLVAATGMLALAFFSLGALWSPRVRCWVLRPDAKMSPVTLGLQAFGAAGVLFALGFLASAWHLR